MKPPDIFALGLAHVLLVASLLCACSSEPPMDESITNDSAIATIEQERAEQAQHMEALKEELPQEAVKQIELHNEKRGADLNEINSASPYKAKNATEIEAMLERWMRAYEQSASEADSIQLRKGWMDDVVRSWRRENPEKMDAFSARFKAVQAGTKGE